MVLLKINEGGGGCKAMPHSSLQHLEPFSNCSACVFAWITAGEGEEEGERVFRCVIAVSTVSE